MADTAEQKEKDKTDNSMEGIIVFLFKDEIVLVGKTSESDKIVTQNFVRQHLDIGIETMQYIKDKNYSMRHLIF